MGIFQNTITDIGQKFRERGAAKDAEKKHLATMRLEAGEIEREEFAKQFKANAAIVARKNAFERAQKESGIKRLQAMSRAESMSEDREPNVFDKLRAHTQKNLASRERNLERTAKLQAEAKKMREERSLNQRQQRTGNIARTNNRSTSHSTGSLRTFGGAERKPFQGLR